MRCNMHKVARCTCCYHDNHRYVPRWNRPERYNQCLRSYTFLKNDLIQVLDEEPQGSSVFHLSEAFMTKCCRKQNLSCSKEFFVKTVEGQRCVLSHNRKETLFIFHFNHCCFWSTSISTKDTCASQKMLSDQIHYMSGLWGYGAFVIWFILILISLWCFGLVVLY